MYEVVSVLLGLFSAMFQGYCLQYFYGNFLETRMRNRQINGLVVAMIYGVLRLGVGIFLPKGYGSLGTFTKLTTIMCIISVIVVIFYRAIGKITLFLVVTFMAASEISFFIAHMFFKLGNHLVTLWSWCWKKGYMPSLECYDIVVNVTLIGIQILIYVIGVKCTLCQVQKVCVLVNIAIFIWIVLLAALSYPFAYPAVGVKVTAGEAEPMP